MKRIKSISSLSSVWQDVKEKFSIPQKASRKHEHIAVKAAFISCVRDMNLFSLTEISSVMSYFDKDNVLTTYSHTSILNLYNKSKDKFYNNRIVFKDAETVTVHLIAKYFYTVINVNNQDIIQNQLTGAFNQTTIDSLSAEIIRLNTENEKLRNILNQTKELIANYE